MEIHFEIDNRCLLNCRHCSSLASMEGEKMQYSEKTLGEFLKNIQEKKEVFLTGGEPLLYPGLDKLLKRLNDETTNLTLGLFTTGIVMEESSKPSAISREYARILSDCRLKICYLSLYSYQENEHDWMTRLKGSFKMLSESVNNLRAEGIEIRFNCVVTRKNYLGFDKIIEVAKSMGATEVRILKLIQHGRACEYWEELGITNEEYRSIVSRLVKREKEIRITASGVIDILPCRYLYHVASCPAGKQLLYITKDGNIFPCASVKNNNDYLIGNIQDVDIYERWNDYQENIGKKILCK